MGRIINPKLADSQALGGMVGGIGTALLEQTITDHRDGRIVNANLADYLVPVNADIPNLRAIYLQGEDREANPIGVKGWENSCRSEWRPPSPTPSSTPPDSAPASCPSPPNPCSDPSWRTALASRPDDGGLLVASRGGAAAASR